MSIAGRNPALYHLFNLAIHLTSVWLAYFAFRKLLGAETAWLGAAIFAVHPFQAEPVNYIFARSSLLSTLFCLAAMWEWVSERPWRATTWFALAVLAKEECATFPVFLILLDIWQLRRPRNLRASAVMLALAGAGAIRVALAANIQSSGAGAHAGITPAQYLSTQGTAIWRYLRLLLLPWGFTVDPDIAIPSPAWGMLGWAGLLALAALAVFGFRKTKPAFWFLGGLILLLPTSSIFPAADLAVDRRMYLPLVAWAPCLALLLRAARPALPIAIVLVLTALSVERTLTWRTEESLWADAVAKAPRKVRPRIQLARAVDPARALQLLQETEAIAPNDPAVASEEGRVLLTMNHPEQALIAFGRALALEPDSATALNNRAVALLQMGQGQAARQDFERALARDPCLFDAHWNLRRLGAVDRLPDNCRWTNEQRHTLEGR
jgi:protein O-mannosyl-transferase